MKPRGPSSAPAPRPVPVTALTTPVERAYERFEARAATWLEGYRARGGRVYCAAGCHLCCDMPIRVSLAEALVMARALSPAERRRVEAHARRVMQNARHSRDDDEYVLRHREEVGFCPLLDRERGVCTQYAARPTRCRDTYSALPARCCAAGFLEGLGPRDLAEYRREVRRTPGTDGQWHFLEPLEQLSEPVWEAASAAMRAEWGVQVWGDFWVLTTLAADPAFLEATARGDVRGAWGVARTRGLAHPTVLEMARAAG